MKKSYKYGIELETIVPRENYNKICNVIEAKKLPISYKSDSSIRTMDSNEYIGVEWITKPVLNYTQLDRGLKSFTKVLSEYDVITNKSCGYHLHISNKRFFNPTTIKKLVFVWASIEDVLLSTQPRSRFGNEYCYRFLESFITKDFKHLPRGKEDLVDNLSSGSRYYTLNLQSLSAHGSIEVRLHSGTTQYTKIMAWVNLILSIYDYVILNYNHEEIMGLFKESISDAKIAKVFKMLGLSEDLKKHFNKRVEKFGFDLLARQQVQANEAIELQPKLLKAKKAFEKIEAQYSEMQRSVDSTTRVMRLQVM